MTVRPFLALVRFAARYSSEIAEKLRNVGPPKGAPPKRHLRRRVRGGAGADRRTFALLTIAERGAIIGLERILRSGPWAGRVSARPTESGRFYLLSTKLCSFAAFTFVIR